MSYGMKDLVEAEGCKNEMEFLEIFALDSVVPGICTKCGYTTGMEPDQDRGWCDECKKNTVVGGLVLAGII